MTLDALPIRTEITERGQRYVDEPVVAEPATHLTTPIAWSVGEMFGQVVHARDPDGMPFMYRKDAPPILLRYEHKRLKWVKPRLTP